MPIITSLHTPLSSKIPTHWPYWMGSRPHNHDHSYLDIWSQTTPHDLCLLYFDLKRKAEVKSSLLETCNKRHKGALQLWYVLELEGQRSARVGVLLLQPVVRWVIWEGWSRECGADSPRSQEALRGEGVAIPQRYWRSFNSSWGLRGSIYSGFSARMFSSKPFFWFVSE